MKKILVIAFVVFSVFGYSQTPDSLFVKGNELYKGGSYQAAIEQYHLIEELQVQSDDLFFNLGNSYYKLNEVAPSIYYFEKALKINPRNKEAQNNLAFANRMTIDAIEVLPQTVFQKFSENIIYQLTYNYWAYLAVSLSFLSAFFFLMYHFSYSSRKKLFYFNASILGAFLLMLSVVFAFKSYDFEVNTIEAIIFQQTTEIRNAPTLNSDTVFELHEGTKVEVLDAIDDWKKIKLSDGKIGWIIAENIREI